MKTIKLLTTGLFITGAMLLSSCKKEGCTNPSADNFDVKAEINDESCKYTTNLVFWFDETQSQQFQANGVEKINFTLSDEPLGSTNTDQFWEESPKCDSPGALKYSKELTKSNTAPVYYKVLDEEGEELLKGMTELTTDSCRVIKLEL